MALSEEDKCYKRGFTKHLLNPLKSEGFKRYKTLDAGRIVGDSIFQFINMQKRTSGIKTFTVNIGVFALFLPREFLPISPGQRIGMFMHPKQNKWWSYETEEKTSNSYSEVLQVIEQNVMPWFREVSSSSVLLREYESNKFDVEWMDNPWKTMDLAMLYLREGNRIKANEYLAKTREEVEFSSDHVDIKVWQYYQKVITALEGGQSAIDQLFFETEQQTRKALGLEKW